MPSIFSLGLELMFFGLVGVFVTLGVFISMIVGLTKLFPYKDE
jgi:hypothetical protein